MERNRQLLQALKRAADQGDAAPCIAVGRPVHTLLRPVATLKGRVRDNDLRVLSDWRNRYVTSFLHEFAATPERTADWLARIVGPDDTKILFMLDDLAGRTFGYMGLAFIDWARGEVEADAIVRGEDAPRGVMSEALRTLLGWARTQLGLPKVGVRVRSDNPALAFYEKLGFVEVQRFVLARSDADDGVKWVEKGAAGPRELALVHMTYTR